MKTIKPCSLILFGVCVAAALTPSIGFADPLTRTTRKRDTTLAQAIKSTSKNQNRTVYVVSNDTPTGSNIPRVSRVYRGVATNASQAISYNDLGITGTDDVATALFKLDPSFTRRR